MPNPNEIQRMIEERNEELDKLEKSRNSISPLCKADKEAAYRRLHSLERSLGLPLSSNKIKTKE